jgi:hypothetical protein
MENVKYEEVYPYMHNHSTRISSFLQGEKFMDLLFLILKWMKKWKEKVGDNQFLYKTEVKQDNKFNYAFRGDIVTVV